MSDAPTTPNLVSPLNPPLPDRRREPAIWSSLHGSADALALAAAAASQNGLFLILTSDSHGGLRLEHEIAFFAGPPVPILAFPDWETLPYDVFSPLPEIVSQRLRTLAELGQGRGGVLITSAATAMQRLPPRSHVLARTFSLAPGAPLDPLRLRAQLEAVGYQCVSQVLQHGDFAVRGSIVDLFPMGHGIPYRIELFDDTIESIRTFDVETQRSIERVDSIRLFPAREFPFDEEAIKRFRREFREQFPEAARHSDLYQDVSKGFAPGGLEYYFPLFVDQTETLFDYLPADTTVILHGDIGEAALAYHEETYARYQQRSGLIDRPPLPPEQLFLEPSAFQEQIAGFKQIWLNPGESTHPVSHSVVFDTRPLPDIALEPKADNPAERLVSFLASLSGRTLFVAETPGHREALRDTLRGFGISPATVDTWERFLATDVGLGLTVGPLEHALWEPSRRIAVITETQVNGEDRVQQRRRRRKSSDRSFEQMLRDLEDLEIGSPVVHLDYGVGRYRGLQRLTVGDIDAEFLTLEYANRERVYVPVASLHLVSRYSGASAEAAPLHRLGSDQWQKAKRRALERARDVAAELLDIYARRAAREGVSLQVDPGEYGAFAAGFPFEETPDQQQAIDEVIQGLKNATPMDRVICGDVGFGKTEVAMRAAFITAQSGRQTAVLVPTTLLAQQHFQNFRDRFADTPFRIELLSRFVGKKQQDGIVDAIARGTVDIVIGTHKLMQKGVQFKNLGLAIIDEEHRFGVNHKEHFKKLRAELDFLTLTATPIPRTLNMALSGLRDISIIATPPPNRHAIKTFVCEWDDGLIQEAILREIKRGGQVYFLHNSIESMAKIAERLRRLVPAARIQVAHGQMPERELEHVMLDFYHQRFNVLVCTTIIESGIDVPSANTIIIDRADLLGLAQLHQLRGRVGRSHHRAYAYLITPPQSAITGDALKRLEAIEASGELGAGFALSTHDLEIRGAGELLGEEQSGQIQEIGFGLYTELLERAVAALKAGREPDLAIAHDQGPEIDLQSPALIPDDYLPDVHSRLVLYKRIAGAANHEALRQLQVEMIDRFGLLPEPTKTLFRIAELKVLAGQIGIVKIEAGASGGRIFFGPEPRIDPATVIHMIQGQPERYRMDGPDKLKFTHTLDGADAKAEFLAQLIHRLAA